MSCSLITKKPVYTNIDWNTDFGKSFATACFPLTLSVIFGTMMIYATKLKFKINGVEAKLNQ